ncbi:MAG: hypothetical protein KF829_08700 [Ferruginibacter sp.]|nr:hypothetical protein [Ferruginibacter sp.]
MKTLFTLTIATLLSFIAFTTQAQTYQYGFNSNDPDNVFTANNRPAIPAWNNYNIVKWGHANRLSWGPFSKGYKSYLYQGVAFRLKFPKTYQQDVNDGKKYPLFIFFHGMGERGDVYDNEYQLLHGGQVHANKVNDGTFDGFLFYAQSTSGASQDYFPKINAAIDSLISSAKVDPDRIIISGLSSGGQATWDFLSNPTYLKKVAAAIPISAAQTNYVPYMNGYVTVPIWLTNGGQDGNPAPYTADYVINEFRSRGGYLRQTFYPNLGHGVWNDFWNEPDYFPYLSKPHMANPLVYFQRNQFCPTDSVNARMAILPGFPEYQWDKDGVVISGANANEYTATSYGTYRVRFRRVANGPWSEWSPTPVVIGAKPGTVSPPIQVNGMYSNVIPAPDGSTTVPLKVPEGYLSYEWRRISDNALVSTTNTYTAGVGSYKVKVSENGECSSFFNDPFEVINAFGADLPAKPSNLSATPNGDGAIELNWIDNPNAPFNETAFEIYRSNTSGSGYRYIGKADADVLTYNDIQVESNTRYYYIIRAINQTGASQTTSEATAKTNADVIAPSAPSFLRVLITSTSSVTLAWDPSSDNVGVVKYDVYVNGVKTYVTTNNESFTAGNLTYQETYSFYVKAVDAAGNASAASNQVNATARLAGLNYKYYEGQWDNLPDFSTLTPVATGTVNNVTIAPRLRDDNFAFLWEGFIKIPVTGSYKFETKSDDGSKLYIGQYSYGATPLVDNDGIHASQYKSGTITLNAGVYPIAITFFENGGDQIMEIYWTSTAAGYRTRTLIPNSAFVETVNIPANAYPAAPTDFNASSNSYNQVNLSWSDNSNNEIGFEILRSKDEFGAYFPIGVTNANVTSYVDTFNVEASTTFWYKIRSFNNYGGSAYDGAKDARWKLNNSNADVSGAARPLSLSGSSYVTDRQEGSHALSFNGSSNYADMPFSSGGDFPSDAYSSRTIALWIKPNSTSINAANKVIVDLGGSDNGMALRFNNKALEGAVCRSSSSQSVSVSNVVNNASWNSNAWNHVALVYNGKSLKLFINGTERGSVNLTNSGTTVGASSGLSRIGASNGSHAFRAATSNNNYGGLIDDVVILPNALSAASLVKLMNDTYVTASSTNLPPRAAAPSNLTATSVSVSQIDLSWTDNSNNENNFELFRSRGNANNFRLLATLPANTTSFQDVDLFSNTDYYYYIRATSIGGNSDNSNEANARTGNNLPVISSVSDFSMQYGTTVTLNFSATDVDGGDITMMIENMPSFGSFTSGNGTASLTLSPDVRNDGDNVLVTVTALDENGGSAFTSFMISVNGNNVPEISPVNDVTIDEGQVLDVHLIANDADGNSSLVWSLNTPLPFAQFTSSTNGEGVLHLSPWYAHAGVYRVVARVTDDEGAFAEVPFVITVNNIEPATQTVYMSMQYNGPNAPAPWNNINSTSTSNLLDADGTQTTVGLDFLRTPWNAGEAGAVTGNNSGVYPDAVIRDYFWFGIFGAPNTVSVNITGLDPNSVYNITLFASSNWAAYRDNGTTVYTCNGETKSIHVQDNISNTITFSGVTPNSSGIIQFQMSKLDDNTPYGVLTSIVLQKPFLDATAPVMPQIVGATAQPDGRVRVSWIDLAYNEKHYQVHRATNIAGPYTVLNSGERNANDTTYFDNSVASYTTYYYKLEAINDNGSSGLTGAVSVTSGNKVPQLMPVSDVVINAGSMVNVSITATDDPGDILSVDITGLPPFATWNLTGNGQGYISINTTMDVLGNYNNIKVTATDNFGGSVTTTFNIRVIDPSVRTVYVNFGTPGKPLAASPWNNFYSFPYANIPMSNLKDAADVVTPFGVRLLAQWDSNFELGMITGGDKGIFPDNVISGSFTSTANVARDVQIEGLDKNKKYNIVIFSSHNAGMNFNVTASSGGQSATLNATYNSNTSMQLNGLVPNSSGIITVRLTKPAASTALNLNAMIIEEYTGTPLFNPYYLFAEPTLTTNKVDLKWSDRSTNESGFQIYRSTSPNSGFSLIKTTSANVTSYTDNTASSNVRYYYKVRAVKTGSNSSFSNVATAILSPSIVFVNFNTFTTEEAPAPWNNTTGPSTVGIQFNNLKDQNGVLSGTNLTITKEFNGPGFTGVNSNSGIFPGKVMSSNYWTDAGQVSQVKFSNLNVSKKYRIGIFGSAISYGYFIAKYSCNENSVYLNSLNNDSKIVYLSDLVPSDQGELYLDCSTLTGSPYSFTSVLTIESYDDNSSYIPVLGRGEENEYVDYSDPKQIEEEMVPTVSVFPNPFVDKLNVEWISKKDASAIQMVLSDLSGHVVYRSKNSPVMAGRNILPVVLNNSAQLTPGAYILSVYAEGKLIHSERLIKIK